MIRSLSRKRRTGRRLSLSLALLLLLAFLPPPPAARRAAGAAASAQEALIPTVSPGLAYRQTNLISDVPGLAPVLDPLLVNPWGISVRGTSPFWLANNGSDTTQLVRGDVGGAPVVLNPSPQTVSIPGGLPTGTVGIPQGVTDFQITPPGGGTPAPANFVFDSITGNITAWNGASGSAAQTVVSMPGHVWTGLAFGTATGGNRLYAADFALNHIDVFNGTFAPTTVPGGFVDPSIPAGYAPFNIQNLGGSLYVTYAKVGPDGRSQAGVGQGYVRKFTTDGVLVPGFAINNGPLNAPWGLAIAPSGFGIWSNQLLVGNFGSSNTLAGGFGNGSIYAFSQLNGSLLGGVENEAGEAIKIDGLWALQFGNGGNGGDPATLYFTAGPGRETHGLFGKLNPTTATATSLIQFASDSFAINEDAGHVDITVTRGGDVSLPAAVNFNTFDEAGAGHASQKSDYEIALGTLNFAPGETSKTVRILLVDDRFVEGEEVIDLMLSNVSGAGVGLGSPNAAEVRILDNDAAPPTSNPIDTPSFFVRQHYLDFLNREPDAAGLAFWTNEIASCAGNAACVENKRVNVSAAFFLSIEFQTTGYLAYLTHRAAFGPTAGNSPVPVLYGNFMRDTQALQKGFVFGAPGAEAVLEANKVAYYNEFVTRPEFASKYPSSQTNEQYVDALLTSAGLTPAQTRFFVVQLTNNQEVPPAVPTTTAGAARPASFGTARFQFNEALTSLTFSATITNIDVTGSQTADTNDNLTAAHIHAGPSVAPGVNGPVVWGFFGAPFNDNNPNDQTFFPNGGVGGTFGGKWDAPEGNNTTLAAQLDNLRAGRAYINFHTRQFGGGEIRGNFPAADAFRNSLVAGLTAGTETRATVLRKIAEAEELQAREFNRAFVALQYFGYLRRNPTDPPDSDATGYNFWLNKLNAFNGNFQNAEMVKAFINSAEYRKRFGPS